MERRIFLKVSVGTICGLIISDSLSSSTSSQQLLSEGYFFNYAFRFCDNNALSHIKPIGHRDVDCLGCRLDPDHFKNKQQMMVFLGPYISEEEANEAIKSLEDLGTPSYDLGCPRFYTQQAVDNFPYDWITWLVKVDGTLRGEKLVASIDKELAKVFSRYDNAYALWKDMPSRQH